MARGKLIGTLVRLTTLVVVVAFSVWIKPAWSQTPAPASFGITGSCQGNLTASTAAGVCTASVAGLNGTACAPSAGITFTDATVSGTSCNYIVRCDGSQCSSGSLTINTIAGGSCPGGSVSDGAGGCACALGYGWNGTTCATSCLAGGRNGWPSATPSSPMPTSVCVGGCVYEPDFYGGDARTGKFHGSGKGTGANCSSSPPAEGPTGCMADQCSALINGATVCLVCGQPGTVPVNIGSGSKLNADGTGSKTTTTRTCDNGLCTNNRSTQQYDANGDPVGDPALESDTEKDVPGESMMDKWCKANPSNTICQAMGSPSDIGTPGTKDVGLSSITPVTVGGAGSCPADVALPKGAVFSFAAMCTTATTLRPLVLALAWLGAGLIVVGGFKRG